MCEPATLTAIGSWFGGTAAAGSAAAAGTGIAAGSASAIGAGLGTSLAAVNTGVAAVTTTASTTAALSTPQLISLGLSAAGTGLTALSAYNQSQTAKEVASRNAVIADQQAADALRRGEKDAMELQRRVAATKSAQRVSLAAKGLDLSYGTAADLQDQTDFFGQSDIATTRTNARKEAWARESQASNFQAEALSSRPWLAGGSTLLAGAGQVADKWYRYGDPRAR